MDARCSGRPRPRRARRTGALTLTLPAYSTSLLQADAPDPRGARAKPVLKVARDSLSSLVRVSRGAPDRGRSASRSPCAAPGKPGRGSPSTTRRRTGRSSTRRSSAASERVYLVAIVRTLGRAAPQSRRSARTFPADEKRDRQMPARRVLPLILFLLALPLVGSASASDTPAPSSVTIAGSLQSELGCSGDWQPDCATTHLAYDASDDNWQGTFTVPAGRTSTRLPLNNALGRELRRERAAERREHRADRARREREVLLRPRDPLGDRQPELGDRDGAGQLPVRARLSRRTGSPTASARGCRIPTATACTRSRRTRSRPGSYEAKVAIDEAWDENYGAGGVPRRREHRVHRRRDGARDVQLRLDDSRPHDHVDRARAVARQQRASGTASGTTRRDRSTACPAARCRSGTPNVTLRFRTFHDDVTARDAARLDVNDERSS